MPKASVVIPSYNHASYISEAVLSVLNQSMSDLELIVVDDGSQDKSLEVLANFSDPRLRVIKQANQGAHAAINRGLQESTGEYLAILNSDDSYHPQRLEKTLAVLEAEPGTGLVGSHIRIVDARNREQGIKHGYHDSEPWVLDNPERSFRAGDDLRAALLTENYLATTSNYVFTRAIYEKVGEFKPLRYAHDWDFALRIARMAPLRLLEEPLLNYRVHARNTIREDQAAMIFEICWVLAVNLPDHLSDPDFFKQSTSEARLDQLLHSIYVYGCELVLNVMLVLKLDQKPELALKLLKPENPSRAALLQYIIEYLSHGNPTLSLFNNASPITRFKQWLRR